MKTTRAVLIVVVTLLLGIGLFFAVSFLYSPEFALLCIANDVNRSGLDGLMPHLTEEAQSAVSFTVSLSESPLASWILSSFGEQDGSNALLTYLGDTDWGLAHTETHENETHVVLRFNYNDKMVGTIPIVMVNEDGAWKISGLGMPTFETFDLAA